MERIRYYPVWSEKFAVRSYDIGLKARMRLNSVCSYFQEIAGKHATHLDAGYKVMQEKGRVWVLSRLFINIHRFPDWNREFEAQTWPLGTERIFFRREYLIKENEETLISATSYWILLDLKTRRPVTFSINEDVLKANKGKYAMEMPSEGFSDAGSAVKDIHRVVYSDLDQNRHVNNARYVAWILDCFDADFHEQFSPSYFAIEYKHEVLAGDSVELYIDPVKGETPAFNVEGRIAGTSRICVRARIRFTATI